MAAKRMCSLVVLCFLLGVVQCLPEQGQWGIMIEQDKSMGVTVKSLYNQSTVAIKIECKSPEEIKVNIQWVMRWTPCAEEYTIIDNEMTRWQEYFTNPGNDILGFNPGTIYYLKSEVQTYQCGKDHSVITLQDDTDKEWTHHTPPPAPTLKINETAAVKGSETEAAAKSRKRRDDTEANAETAKAGEEPKAGEDDSKATNEETAQKEVQTQKPDKDKVNDGTTLQETSTLSTTPTQTLSSKSGYGAVSTKTAWPTMGQILESESDSSIYFDAERGNDHLVARVPHDGSYVFIINIEPFDVAAEESKSTFNATVNIKMKGPQGYLSAIEWPLLPFYGAMCLVYIVYGLVWLVLIMCNWRDLLRIQFWIGGVIFLGMLEKAVFFAEYESINSTGISVQGAMVFAELVSCGKRTLARMLVVIVSLGFGIVKPRLGPMLHRVLGVGALYFILASVEACLRVLKPKGDVSRQTLLAGIPLAVIDATICWWVFTSLVQTTRTLRLRRNLVKLSLYRHFTNTLIFAVLASVAFMIWSIKEHKFTSCLTDWKEMWVDDAFWHLLFSIILLVIMILWRPTINNQRYAFSPLLDAADDEEEEEPMITDAYSDGMKMRGKGQNGSPLPRDSKSKAEEDLKWIEENIPATVSDTALPSLLDSDEEIMTTRFEMSKME